MSELKTSLTGRLIHPLIGISFGLQNRFLEEIAATGGRLVTVEDHWAEGGIGEAVLAALAQANAAPSRSRLLAVRNMPHSGKPDELIDAFGISAQHIVEAKRQLLWLYHQPTRAH
jgi:transketolase C-terminal domain/subunit